jgi:hypothetical protein
MLIFLAILAFVWGYKKAKRTGRQPWLWSLICGFTFLGTQVLISIALAGVIAIGVTFFGWSEDLLDKSYYPVGIAALIAGMIALQIMFYCLDRAPKAPAFPDPPAPPRFDSNEER